MQICMSTNSPLHGALVHPKIPSFRSTIPGFYHTKNKRSKYKNKTFIRFSTLKCQAICLG